MPFDIASRVESWRAQLLDTSKRNRLINFKTGRAGGIALAHLDPGDMWHRLVVDDAALTFPWQRDLIDLPADAAEDGLTLSDVAEETETVPAAEILKRCLHSPHLKPDHLLTDLSDRRLAARLTRLALAAHESLTEQGVAVLYIAFGFLRWFESPDSETEVRSPLLLVPVRLERDNVEAPWKLRAEEDDILPNHSLAQLLANDFRLTLPTPEEPADFDDPAWRTRYLGEVQRCVRDLPRWEVLDEAALGAFGFQKLAMWEDLGRNRDRIAAHDLCRAIAGDPAVVLPLPSDLPVAEELDRVTHPKQTFHILDADSSQHEAIAAATRGASLVLDGPPGTGKSQTIANVIAEFLAVGKTVLFVSEKAAALEVVQRRLQERGLGDFCLACHSHRANKRAVVAELGRCLGLEPDASRDPSEDLQRLYEARARLNEYVRELHAPRSLGMSIYQAHGELARLARLGSVSLCPVPRAVEGDPASLRQGEELLARLPDCRHVIAARGRYPWRGCRAPVYSETLRDQVRQQFGRLADCLGQLVEPVGVLHRLGLCIADPTRAQWFEAVASARAVLACPLVPAEWFRDEPRQAAEAAVQLDEVTQACRRARAALPEFAPAALKQAAPDTFSEVGESPRLLPRQGETVRGRAGRLQVVAASLRELQTRAAAAEQTERRLDELVRAEVTPPVEALPRLAEWAKCLATLPPVRRSWWNAGRRKELESVLTRCQEERRLASETRAELALRLSPPAFMPESAALADRAGKFRSFLGRLFRGWRSFKSQLSGWYSAGLPGTTALLDDLDKLAAYHRREVYLRQVAKQYVADLLAAEGEEIDWDETLKTLRTVDRLEQFVCPPTGLRAVIAEDRLDRPALAEAADELTRQAAALRQQLETVARDYDLAAVTDGEAHKVRLIAAKLATWAGEQADAVARQGTLLGRVVQLLAEEQDFPVAILSDRLRTLAELGRLRAQLGSLGERCGWRRPLGDVEEQDWSSLRATGEGLLRLLDGGRVVLSPETVKALTDDAVRRQIEAAVRHSDTVSASSGFEESTRFLAELFDPTADISTGITLEQASLEELRRWLQARIMDVPRLHEWVRFHEVEREAARLGLSSAVAEVLAGRVKAEEAVAAHRARFLRVWLDAIYANAPALRQFGTDAHERLIERFRDLDRRSVVSAADRIRRFQLTRSERPRLVTGAPESSELGMLLHEVYKKRRHLPLRKLFASMPALLLRLKPCLMMSPLAVSTFLDAPDFQFDLVIFDEASQVRPHDAICAIYRGRQLIVAGDQKQLPPTSFFARVLEDVGATSEDGGGLEDYESILDVCGTLSLPRRRLRWHYRSRREGLIAFANRHIYNGELVTFPSVEDAGSSPAVRFEYLAEGRWKAGTTGGYNAIEARRTAELVLDHCRDRPERSLGVIAFSQRQQLRILDELERLRRANPGFEEFFDEDSDEPFFVKNLENVQGDERDVIFLSVGYGPDETGRVAMRFGPLNLSGGERRLNVAVTRARREMVVVSSLRAADVDLSRTAAVGAALLRAWLDYAERGPEALGTAVSTVAGRDFDSPFEEEVFEELTRRGLTVHPQVGCSGYRIDLGVVDAAAPGRYLLGVECDGASYHSSATARDRDRLRQQVLEGLGWRLCRVWSPDWLRDREGQVARVQAALEQARQQDLPPEAPAGAGRPLRPPPPAPPVVEALSEAPAFDSIDEVSEDRLRQEVCEALVAFGATEVSELIQAVARRLGFKRTGSRIQARTEACLGELMATGQVCHTADGRLQVTPRTASVKR